MGPDWPLRFRFSNIRAPKNEVRCLPEGPDGPGYSISGAQDNKSRIPGAPIMEEWFRDDETRLHTWMGHQSPDLNPTQNLGMGRSSSVVRFCHRQHKIWGGWTAHRMENEQTFMDTTVERVCPSEQNQIGGERICCYSAGGNVGVMMWILLLAGSDRFCFWLFSSSYFHRYCNTAEPNCR